MRCYNCGNEITTDGTNCPFCGSPLSQDAGNTAAYNQQAYGQQPYGQQPYGQQPNYAYNQPAANTSIEPKTAAIICYLTWVGFLIALLASDKNHPFLKHHLNNALVLMIGGLVLGFACIIPLLGWIAAGIGEIFLFICLIMGIIGAINGEETVLPLIGQIQLIK